MKKLCALLLMALLMVPALVGADDYFVPDPEHFFGEEMVDPQGATYTMYFDEDPLDMFNAYVSLLQTDYDLKKRSISDYSHILTHEGVRDSGVTIEYFSDEDGYRIEICIHSLVTTGKREQYDPEWNVKSAVSNRGLVLLSPASFFDGAYSLLSTEDCKNAGANWVVYTFAPTSDRADEELEADAEMFRQALIGSGYFEEQDGVFDLVYTGAEKVSAAAFGGINVGGHVSVNANEAIRVTLVEGFRFSDIALAEKEEEPAATDAPDVKTKSNPGTIAWDDGRMIADPGDFLGYEIAVTDILDMTNYKYGGYYFTRYYEEIDMADILKYIDALDASPYFEICSTDDASVASYRIIHFLYTGPDSDLAALCKDSHRNKRTCDLYIHIDYRNRERSTFRITSYPGFTVDSVDYVPEPTPGPIPPDRQDCIFCDNGSCKNCGGSGFVYQYAAGYKDEKRRVDCSSCLNGRCSFCDGNGWR